MDIEKLYWQLENLSEKEIMIYTSAIIEYLLNARGCDFKDIMKHLKNCHKYVVQNEE